MGTLARFCTWNIGDGGSWGDLQYLMDRFPVIGLQEMSDRQGMKDKVKGQGFQWYDAGGGNGRAATPLIWDPDVTGPVVEDCNLSLTPETKCAGTGPDTVKAKWLIGKGWDWPGVGPRVRVATMHAPADQGKKCRGELAHDCFVGAANKWNGMDGPVVILGDLNCAWNHSRLDPFRKKGFKPAQGTAGGPRTTHGDGWEPDQQWYDNCKPTASGVVKNGSDHHAYWVEYALD